MRDELQPNVRPFPLTPRTGRSRAPLRVQELGLELLDQIEGGPADTAVLPIWADERPLTGLAALIDWRTCGQLSRALRDGITTGERGESTLTMTRRLGAAWRLLLVGMGPRGGLDREDARALGEAIFAITARLGARKVLLGVPSGRRDPSLALTLVEAIAGRLQEAASAAASPREAPLWWAVTEPELVPYLRALAEG